MEKKLHIIRTDEVSKEETGLPPAFSRRPLASKRQKGKRWTEQVENGSWLVTLYATTFRRS